MNRPPGILPLADNEARNSGMKAEVGGDEVCSARKRVVRKGKGSDNKA